MSRLLRAGEDLPVPAFGPGEPAGCFVAIAGPSGAGKDSLIRGMATRYVGDQRFVFARRFITRAVDATEDHHPVSEQDFARLKTDNAFLLSWSANGLSYALPGSLGQQLAQGHVVVANVSRASLPEIRARFTRCVVIHVTARPQVLAMRLAQRGREDAAGQRQRLIRAMQQNSGIEADVTIDNSDALAAALERFAQVLEQLACQWASGH